jgi:hypothetical protein
MMPKSAKRFSLTWTFGSRTRAFGSDDIMLQLIGIDHVHDFGSIRSKIIVI